ncbi:MAG: hypothetical protein R3D32_01270 [Nitratireductor sp.]
MQTSRITVIGPVSAGKTGLILSMGQCINFPANSHGFPEGDEFRVVAADAHDDGEIEFTGAAHMNSEVREYLLQFNNEFKNTAGDASIARKFNFTRDSKGSANPLSAEVEIVDTGGEMSDTKYWSQVSDLQKELRENPNEDLKGPLKRALAFQNFVLSSDAIVMVVPAIGFKEREHVRQFQTFLSKTTRQEKSRLRRIIVAWSRIDLLLAPFKHNAADIAHQPELVFQILRTLLQSHHETAQMLDRYDTAAKGNDPKGVSVHHIAVSSHGFLNETGGANLVFKDDPALYAGTTDDKEGSAKENWHPYLAADPFLCAIFGPKGNRFCFPHSQLVDTAAGSDEPLENTPDPADRRNGRWNKFRIFGFSGSSDG